VLGYFSKANFSSGEVDFSKAKFSGGLVYFRDPGQWSAASRFLFAELPPGVRMLPHEVANGAEID
jgi:hypothetical protein